MNSNPDWCGNLKQSFYYWRIYFFFPNSDHPEADAQISEEIQEITGRVRRVRLSEESERCGRCGRQDHCQLRYCPAKGKKCRRCGKRNHFGKMCKTASGDSCRNYQNGRIRDDKNTGKVIVSNLHSSVEKSDLIDLFERIIGPLYYVKMLPDQGSAEVSFVNLDDVYEAIECFDNRILNYWSLPGKPMQCHLYTSDQDVSWKRFAVA